MIIRLGSFVLALCVATSSPWRDITHIGRTFLPIAKEAQEGNRSHWRDCVYRELIPRTEFKLKLNSSRGIKKGGEEERKKEKGERKIFWPKRKRRKSGNFGFRFFRSLDIQFSSVRMSRTARYRFHVESISLPCTWPSCTLSRTTRVRVARSPTCLARRRSAQNAVAISARHYLSHGPLPPPT